MKAIFLTLLLAINGTAFAAVKSDKMTVKVQGMVCSFCAQGIKKNFAKEKSVKSTDVNLDKMEVTIVFNKGKRLKEDKIKEIITGAGFKYVGIKEQDNKRKQ